MNEPAANGSLELEVTDFGPIAKARVDLRPLTVFVGPSNTGKSYLAILIYALHRYFSGGRGFVGSRFRGGSPIFHGRGRQDLSDAAVDALLDSAQLVDTTGRQDEERIVLSPPAVDALRSALDENADALASEIWRCFGIGETGALTRKGRANGARIVMRRRIPGDSNPLEHVLTLEPKTKFRTTIPKRYQSRPT